MAKSSSPELGTSHALLPTFRWERMLAGSCHPWERTAEDASPMAAQEASKLAPCAGALRQLWFLTGCQAPFKLSSFRAMERWIAAATALPYQTPCHSALRHSKRGLGGCSGEHWFLVVWRQQGDSGLWKTPARTDTTELAPEQSPCSFRLRETQGNLTPEKALCRVTLQNLVDSVRLHCFWDASRTLSSLAGAAKMD